MGMADGFTRKYGIHRLVYFEQYGDVELAIQRESASSDGIGPGRFD
jgi:putative endonuclease